MPRIPEASRGDWLRPRAGSWATAGGVAGTGFEAYARILHPVRAYREDPTAVDGRTPPPIAEERSWRWADVAARTGRHIHPLVQWTRLSGHEPPRGFETADGWTVGPPEEGQLDPVLLAALTDHLRPATTAPSDLIAAVWNGWGDLNGGSASASFTIGEPTAEEIRALQQQALDEGLRRAAIASALSRQPLFEWPGRDFHLMSVTLDLFADLDWLENTSVSDYPASGRTPQMLWPEDHTWVLATEIDWDATIVAGTRTLVADVVADHRFEAFEVSADDDLSWAGDTINHG